jgi:hypothetical protein
MYNTHSINKLNFITCTLIGGVHAQKHGMKEKKILKSILG